MRAPGLCLWNAMAVFIMDISFRERLQTEQGSAFRSLAMTAQRMSPWRCSLFQTKKVTGAIARRLQPIPRANRLRSWFERRAALPATSGSSLNRWLGIRGQGSGIRDQCVPPAAVRRQDTGLGEQIEPAFWGRLVLRVLRMPLENNLQGELGVVGFAGADAGRAVGDADGRGAPAKRAP